jgi:phosphatidylglycerophosphatase C
VKTIAVFDFDKTLSTRDNVLPFLRAAVGTPRLVRDLALVSPRLVAAALSDAQRDAAKAALVRHTLTGYDAAALAEVAERFASEVVERYLRREIVERLEWHRGEGHEVVIVSASLAIYLRPVAARLGGVDVVLATELEVGADGRLTGALRGTNVRRAEKTRRLDAWLGDGPAYVWAYGDSRGDTELLARADRPVRV